jgi:hypothetical protein
MIRVKGLVAYFKANPQVFLLLVICVVLGLGTFIAVVIALAASGNSTPTGEPSGVIVAGQALSGAAQTALRAAGAPGAVFS